MILRTDRGYQEARRVRQGKARLAAEFDGFAARFEGRYGFAPLWLETDHLDAPLAGRLDVVLERTAQYRRFLTRGANYRPERQREIAEMLVETVPAHRLRALFGLPPDADDAALDTASVFVCFSDFESAARDDAHLSVTEAERAGFEASLDLGDQLWLTPAFIGAPIVFVRTEEQAAALRDAPVREQWADAYYAVVARHDEFGYLSRDDITIHVDSRENFETTFEGNWMYYVK